MQPPIPPGTTLQNRYRITKTLGQGGFGRTYLAEDQARFKEICVIKEYLIPTQGGTYALQKSKELFQREAAVLYQIQHPQIPQFRASFEQGKRLFLVQDYIDGKTYRDLLDDRLEKGQTFTEAETVQFLQQMLPVLEHVHSKGIIHRDISPENIILRQSDRLPVLIDFGAVKQVAAQLQSSPDVPQATTMGKIGYSPDEQLRTGQVFPNSDLYALAVTAVVLMTGKKPQDLLDQTTMTWRWHQWVPTLSSWFAKVLNRMLNPRPNNRYQSATEVAQALRSLAGLLPTTDADPTAIQTSNTVRQSNSTVSAPATNPLWNSPWSLAAIVAGAALLFTAVPLVLVGSVLSTRREKISQKANSTPVPTFTNSPDLSNTPAPSPTGVLNVQPVTPSDRLTVPPGQTLSQEGNLKANQTIAYAIAVQQDQQLSVSLSRGFCTIAVLSPNKEPLAQQVQQWQGTSPVKGDYHIEVTPQAGITQSDYKLDISLGNSAAPTPSLTPSASPSTP